MEKVEIYPDAAALARAAAERFVAVAEQAIAERGQFVVALSGGSTPRATYERLAGEPLAARMEWSRVDVFWADERCVPPDHPDSNYRMARGALLDSVPIPAGNVHRVCGELPPDRAAAAYQAELETFLGTDGRFDLVLLGMGTDGHTASIFPGTRALDERERAVIALYVERLRVWRVTLTLPIINAARHVLFLVSGAAKANALARVQAGEPLPAGQVQPCCGQLVWLVDRRAASAKQRPVRGGEATS
jgi:6-phosphogluconolactonase